MWILSNLNTANLVRTAANLFTSLVNYTVDDKTHKPSGVAHFTFGTNSGEIGRKWDKSGLFKISYQSVYFWLVELTFTLKKIY